MGRTAPRRAACGYHQPDRQRDVERTAQDHEREVRPVDRVSLDRYRRRVRHIGVGNGRCAVDDPGGHPVDVTADRHPEPGGVALLGGRRWIIRSGPEQQDEDDRE
ncbi:hypothetical protein GCM10027610_117700 [Dactylosporangium cerinum]